MATLNQLLKLQQQIEAIEDKLEQKIGRRSELIEALGLNQGDCFQTLKAENFVTIDGAPHRLWVSANGHIELEALKF